MFPIVYLLFPIFVSYITSLLLASLHCGRLSYMITRYLFSRPVYTAFPGYSDVFPSSNSTVLSCSLVPLLYPRWRYSHSGLLGLVFRGLILEAGQQTAWRVRRCCLPKFPIVGYRVLETLPGDAVVLPEEEPRCL